MNYDMKLLGLQPEWAIFWDMWRDFICGYGQYSICGKTRGGQQCIFDVFLTKPVEVNENLAG